MAQIGIIPSKILPPDIDETPIKNEKPSILVERLARTKALKISETEKNTFILAADTVVAVGGRILGKPENEEEARKYLQMISGRRHRVIGGICLITDKGTLHTRTVQTMVKVKRLTNKEIETYIRTEEWQGKAGAYGIQGAFAMYVSTIQGSYSNIVGLCLHQTYKMLDGNGCRDFSFDKTSIS